MVKLTTKRKNNVPLPLTAILCPSIFLNGKVREKNKNIRARPEKQHNYKKKSVSVYGHYGS